MLTPQKVAFAEAIVSGMSQADAYRAAYNTARMKPETIRKRASELMRDGDVSAMVAAGREKAMEASQVTLDSHLQMLATIRDKALKDGKFAAAASAEIARGKASGLYVEKHEVKQQSYVQTVPEEENLEAWAAKFKH